MFEIIKKYDRSIVFIFTLIVGMFGAYHIFKNAVQDIKEIKPEVRELRTISDRHEVIIQTIKEGQTEMRQDIKAILRALK